MESILSGLSSIIMGILDPVLSGIISILTILLAPDSAFCMLIFTIINTIVAFLVGTIYNAVVEIIGAVIYEIIDYENILMKYAFFNDVYDKMLVIAMALFVLIFSFQMLKSMSTYLGFEVDEPWRIAMRSILFGFLMFYAKDVCVVVMDIFSRIMRDVIAPINEFAAITQKVDIKDYYSKMSNTTSWLGTGSIIIDLILIFKFLSLTYKFFERRMISVFLTMVSPLAFACGISKATKDILKGWTKMFAGNLVIQILQMTMFIVALELKNAMPDSGGDITGHIVACFTILSVIGIIDRMEEMLQQAGLASGGSLGATMGPLGALQSLANNVMYPSSTISSFFSRGGGVRPNPAQIPGAGGGGGAPRP